MNIEIFTTSVRATPSLNQLKGRWVRLNWKKRYLKELQGYDLAYGLKGRYVKRVLTYQRFGSKELDYDNMVGGTKALTDCIKELGLIVDDSPKWCEVIFLPQVKVPKILACMKIKLEEIKYKYGLKCPTCNKIILYYKALKRPMLGDVVDAVDWVCVDGTQPMNGRNASCFRCGASLIFNNSFLEETNG